MTLTPEQFNKLATKAETNELKTELVEVKTDVSKILSAVDGLAKKFDNFHAEMAANTAAHDRYEEAISDLKKRVRILERGNKL